MRYVVIGNINSGKTTLAKKLSELLPYHKNIAIDDYRIQFGDGTLLGEEKARAEFAQAVNNHPDAIVECSGGGLVAQAVIDMLDRNSVIVFRLSTPASVCLSRLAQKDFSKIPYPSFNERIEDTIIRLDSEFSSGQIDELWRKVALKIVVVYNESFIDEFPFTHYELLDEIRRKISSIDSSSYLVSFGSLGRGELKKTSDIDLFLMTNQSVHEWYMRLKSNSNFELQVMGNQISINQSYSVFAELVLISDLNQLSKFYFMSEIKDSTPTVLLGTDQLIMDLQDILNHYHYSIEDEIAYTKARLQYYVDSLSRIIAKGDVYKFYFHSNIIVHEIVRLSAFARKQHEFNYLPRMAESLIKSSDWSIILYRMFDDMNEYNTHIKAYVSQLFAQLTI